MKTETLKKFESVINGPHSAIFCKTMGILTSGYGKFDVDNNVLFVKFFVEEIIKFQFILFIIYFLNIEFNKHDFNFRFKPDINLDFVLRFRY